MTDFSITMDVKTVIAVGTLVVAIAIGWATMQANTRELRTMAAAADVEAKETHERLDAVQRQLVELTVTLKLKGVTP